MKISHHWVQQYLPVEVGAEEMGKILTDTGLEVEHVDSLSSQIPYLENVIVGLVERLEAHPDADRLQVATVDVGDDETLRIICGAPNIAEGVKVPVAKVGAHLRNLDGAMLKIKKAKIRGVESYGMICSEAELGIDDGDDGIWILPDDAPLGTSIAHYLDLENSDTIYTIGLTPNRTDAMSHIGVAINVAAYLSFHRNAQIEVQTPATKFPTSFSDTENIEVHIEDDQACPRYMGLVLKEVQVKESPQWIQNHLKAVGVKPINNVVDITNFVLKECGQPLHAFDKSKITGDQVIVRKAKNGEKITTLDGESRDLIEDDLLICNDQAPMCIAGVYGGIDSGVTGQTDTIFLESAYFDPTTIRRTSLRLNLRTDAATRYEKGVDISMLRYALYRAALLLQKYADAVIVNPLIDQYPRTIEQCEIDFKLEEIDNLIGKKYARKDVERLLKALHFDILSSDPEGLKVAVPFALHDVVSSADIAEEVLRIDGLNNIPMTNEMRLVPPRTEDFLKSRLVIELQNHLSSIGFMEIMTNSIVDSKYFPDEEQLVRMINNLSANLDVMRPTLLHSGLEAIAYNVNRQQDRLKFFEIGRTYLQKDVGQYIEEEKLGIWTMGTKQAIGWDSSDQKQDVYAMRAIIGQLLMKFGITVDRIEEEDIGHYYEESYVLKMGKLNLATIAKVSSKVLKGFDLKQDVWYAELKIKNLLEHQKKSVQYKAVSKFPSVKRDLALLLDQKVEYRNIQKSVDDLRLNLLREYGLFDIYEGDKIPENKKSLAMSFIFESDQRTLTIEEVDESLGKIVNCLQEKLGAELRK